jgi:hypothetical protein
MSKRDDPSKRWVEKQRRANDELTILRLKETNFRPFDLLPDNAIYHHKSGNGVEITLKVSELRTQPAFDKPVNGRRKWKAHMVLWTLEWLDAVLYAPYFIKGTSKFPTRDHVMKVMKEFAAKSAAEYAAQERDIEAILARYPGRLQRVPAPAPVPPSKHLQTQESERDMADWAMHTVRMIWDKHYGKKNRSRYNEPNLAKEIVAQWIEWIPDNEKNKHLKETGWVKRPNAYDIDRLRHKSGPSGKK